MGQAPVFIAITLSVAITATAGVGAFNAWIDPFMQYRMPSYQPRYVTGFARHINAGLARNLRYDSIVVGSSYAMNFRNSDFDREFDARTASLVMPGMFVSEGRKVVDYASSLKPVKRVFFGLDYFAFVESNNRYEFPDYLYDSSWVNDGSYLLSIDTLKRSIYIALDRGPYNFNNDPDMPFSWAGNGIRAGREQALLDYAKRKEEPVAGPYPLEQMERVAREQIGALVAQHPRTEFEFFLPPYSALSWILDARQDNLTTLLQFRSSLASLIASYPNAHLHDFQALHSLVCDLNRYVDVGHYGPDDNRMIVSAMRGGKFLASPEIVRANNVLITELALGRCFGTITAP